MQSVQHIAASKTAARAFVDSALSAEAFGVERAPVDLKVAMINLFQKNHDLRPL